jgi:hypothetical protein
MPEAERSAHVYVHYAGGPDSPQLVELEMGPDLVVAPHAHAADEIIVVKEGSLTLGARACPAGTSIFIPKDTLYSFRTGPAGVTFLNFRPVADYAHYSKDEFLARRHAASPGTAAESDAPVAS